MNKTITLFTVNLEKINCIITKETRPEYVFRHNTDIPEFLYKNGNDVYVSIFHGNESGEIFYYCKGKYIKVKPEEIHEVIKKVFNVFIRMRQRIHIFPCHGKTVYQKNFKSLVKNKIIVESKEYDSPIYYEYFVDVKTKQRVALGKYVKIPE